MSNQSLPCFADVMRIICDPLPASLISDAGRRRLIDRVTPLPPGATETIIGLEIHCDDPEASADIFFSVSKDGGFPAYFIEQGDKDGGPIGKATAAAFRALLGDETPVDHAIDAIMLEYDVRTKNTSGMWPALFLATATEKIGAKTPGNPNGPRRYRDAAQAALAFGAAGMPITEATKGALQRVFEVMGEDMVMSHAGIFPGREPAIGRLNIAYRKHVDIPDRLTRMGWPGDSGPITDIMAEFADLTPNYRLALDLYDGQLLPRLGVEATQEPFWYESDPAQWNRFITRLEERGLCLAEKAAGLRAWCGQELGFNAAGSYNIFRAFNHFKFDMKDNKTVTARAYASSFLIPQPPAKDEKTRLRALTDRVRIPT